MTPCPAWRDPLLDFVLGGLGPVAVRELEDHLRVCPPCADALVELRARAQELDAALTQFVRRAEPSPDFRARVLAALDARPSPALHGLAAQAALAAAALFLLAGALLPSLGPRLAGRPQPEPHPVLALSTWRSPTESLLRSPASSLLNSTPRFGEFYFPLESLARKGNNHKGENDET